MYRSEEETRRFLALKALWDMTCEAIIRKDISPADAEIILTVLRKRIDTPLDHDVDGHNRL